MEAGYRRRPILRRERLPCVVALDDDRLEDATFDDLRDALRHGGTIHIEQVGRWSPAVAGAEAALGRLLGGERFSANLYAHLYKLQAASYQ
jgi:hypothetical protein